MSSYSNQIQLPIKVREKFVVFDSNKLFEFILKFGSKTK